MDEHEHVTWKFEGRREINTKINMSIVAVTRVG
jgi:hypothetical protein